MAIAIFDFDGTLTSRDSFIGFARYATGNFRLFKALVQTLPVLIGWKLGIKSNSDAKQRLFSALYKGMSYSHFLQLGKEFESWIDANLRSDMKQHVEYHLTRGDQLTICSASIREWIEPWSKRHGFTTVIATEVEITDDGYLTGRFSTSNCHGTEKAKRIRMEYPDIDRIESYGYGDSSGDDAMLKIVTHPTKLARKQKDIRAKG